jgi:hypothetical protein
MRDQFRNVRKRKRLTVQDNDHSEAKAEQPGPWPRRARLQADEEMKDSETPLEPSSAADEEIKDTEAPDEAFDINSEVLDPTQVAQVELSQTNSLYSPDVGDVPHPQIEDLHLPVHRQLFVDTSARRGQDAGTSGQDLVFHYDEPKKSAQDLLQTDAKLAAEVEDVPTRPGVRINLNETAPKTGRPKTSRADIVAQQKTERTRFNAAEDAKRASGELTMELVLDNLDVAQPGLDQCANRLAGIVVKYQEFDSNRPKLSTVANPVLNQDPYYILPPRLLKACMALLPVGTRNGEVLRVGTPDNQPPRRQSPRNPNANAMQVAAQEEGAVQGEVVVIARIGMYRRKHIQDMCRAAVLKKQVEDGRKFVAWFRLEVAPLCPPVL